MLDQEPMPPLSGGVAVQKRHERAAVDKVGGRGACQLGKGGSEVDVEANGVCYSASWHARTAHDQGNMDRFLVRRLLAEWDPMLTEEVAVVRGEDDVGVVQGAGGAEGFDDRADHLVHRKERAQPPPVAIVDECDLVFIEPGERLHPGRFVADVSLFKRRDARCLHAGESSRVTGGGCRRTVRGERRYIEEEGIAGAS